MFEIDVRGNTARGIREGVLTFEYEGDKSLIDIPYAAFASPVKADLGYKIFENGEVEVTGSIAFSLKGQCSRCLSDVERTYEGEVDALFVPNLPSGEEDYGYFGGKIDLREALRDALMFALPARLECESECSLPAWE